MIYKDLNFKELIQLATTHPQNQGVIGMLFKDKFAKSKFKIQEIDGNFGTIVSSENIIIESFDFETILTAFRLFGDLIYKLDVYYWSFIAQPEKLRMLNEHINEYLSRSLTDLALRYFQNDCLAGLQGPFTKVESVKFSHPTHGAIYSDTTDFSAIFPALRRLDLFQMKHINPKTLEHHFPRLEYYRTDRKWIDSVDELSILERRLKLNPQLRHLSLTWTSLDVLEVVSKNMPNLYYLEIHEFNEFDINREDIHFPNVTTFKLVLPVSEPDDLVRIPIVFDNLEEFICGDSEALWFNFIVRNNRIKKITTEVLDANGFERMINEFPNLKEYTMDFYDTDYASLDSCIEKIVEKGNKLEKLSFLQAPTWTADALIRHLTPKWNMTRENGELIFRHD